MSATKRLAIKIIETLGGFKALQWYNRSTPLVLMYHRVINEPFIYGLSPAEFEKQIAYIAKRFRVVSMNTLIDEIKTNSVKPYTIALTFDDGHADFYTSAWPILKKYQIPASLYITTDFINGKLWLWPDLLKYALLNNTQTQIDLAPLGTITLTQDQLLKAWHLLGDYCLTLGSAERLEFIANFAQAANVTLPDAPVTPFTAVTWEQLSEMQQQGLNIGSHTVTHPILSLLSDAEIKHELQASADNIQTKLGQAPKGICYPNGRMSDINDAVLTQAKALGYEYGLLAQNMPINKDDLYLIGRLASHSDLNYFRWTLCRRPAKQHMHYIG